MFEQGIYRADQLAGLSSISLQGKGNPMMIWICFTFICGCNWLAQVRRAPECAPGMLLAGC
jgi:hypothetical protein